MFRKNNLIILAVIIAIIALFFILLPNRNHVYKDLRGPVEIAEMPAIPKRTLSQYDNGDVNALAILITDKNSNWLGLAHGLKTIGVPFRMTDDVESALTHDVVMVYPMISGRIMEASDLRRLARHPESGGVLIGTNVLGGGLQSIFGFESVLETKAKTHLVFQQDQQLTRNLPDMNQNRIKIGSHTELAVNPGTNVYINPTGPVIARYEDGSAAITGRLYDKGAAFAFGVDLGQLMLKGHNFSEVDISESYVNQYQPTLDALLILIRELYKYGEADAVTLGTVPNGKSLSVLMTHDVDYKHSLKNAVEYARMEKSHGVRSTYFIQTKYIHDYNDVSFLDDEGLDYMRQVNDLGMEIASHSVSHSLQFHEFDLGTGAEIYPDYQPTVSSPDRTIRASLMGEARVSKFILESQIDGIEVKAFRPGYLRVPRQLPETLLWSGYKYSSAVTANKSLTHLPFQLMQSRAYENEIDIFEFPVTVDDETLPRMDKRLPEAKLLADKLAKYGGTFVVLSHPDVLEHKFAFAEGFIKHVKAYAWFGSMSDFGDWWHARNAVQIKIDLKNKGKYLTLTCPEAIEGLTVHVPESYKLDDANAAGGVKITAPNSWLVNCTQGQLSLKLADITR